MKYKRRMDSKKTALSRDNEDQNHTNNITKKASSN